MAQTDLRELPRNDRVFLGLGVAVFIASFLPWYGASVSASFGGQSISSSASVTAWHGWAALGVILMLVATLIVAVQRFSDAELPTLMLSWTRVVLLIDVVGAGIFVIRSIRLPSESVAGFSVGLRWGGWLLMIVAIAQVVFAALRVRDAGESLTSWRTAAAPPPPPPM